MITLGTRISHEHYGKGKVVAVEEMFYRIDFGQLGVIEISRRNADKIEVIQEEIKNENSVFTMEELEKTLIRILNEYSDIQKPIPLGDKWKGGILQLKPGNASLKLKEIPMDVFFHKIVMVRDRLRVLEQHINSNEKLSGEDKVNLQQYITRIYGSLTTFNVLFANEEDHFVGDKKSGNE